MLKCEINAQNNNISKMRKHLKIQKHKEAKKFFQFRKTASVKTFCTRQ